MKSGDAQIVKKIQLILLKEMKDATYQPIGDNLHAKHWYCK